MTSDPAGLRPAGEPRSADPARRPAPLAEPTPAPTTASSPPPLQQHRIRRTRTGGAWVAAGLFAVVLLLLLIFILQNGQKVTVSYFGATGHLPLGVAVLLAAVLGILLVVIPGTGRIVQLRMTARRHRKSDVSLTAPEPPHAPQPD
jgi:lipopolysaccharide assembly protein A